MQDQPQSQPIGRRQLLAATGAFGLANVASAQISLPPRPPHVDVFTRTCHLTPAATAGPFYLDLNLLREDITEGKPGLPMRISVKVVSFDNCLPIKDAVVDLWHCDALGVYSGIPSEGTAGQTFLRGHQVTDLAGVASFKTIFPGWYTGRTTHFHFKVFLNNQTLVTSQLYFQDNLPDLVYTQVAPYDTRGPRDTTNDQDAFMLDETIVSTFVRPNGSLISGIVVAVM
jgi:protocatechuate 3,4-dioxygenase beta subunit